MGALVFAGVSARATSPAEERGIDILSEELTGALDPASGAASGDLSIAARVATVNDGATLELELDPGLVLSDASCDVAEVTVDVSADASTQRVSLTLVPAPPVGTSFMLRVAYAGRLVCPVQDARGHRWCSHDPPVGHLRRGSLFPFVRDPLDGNARYDTYRRSLQLSLPSDRVAVGPGQASVSTRAGNSVWRWRSDIVHDAEDLVVVFGDLVSAPVPLGGAEPATRLWYLRSDPSWAREMVDWTTRALPFLTELTGRSLPFDQVEIVKLPAIAGFDGTTSTNLVLLSQTYGDLGAEDFERTLAHELSHLWWGGLVFADERSYWLLEGLARFSELEYAAAQYPSGIEGFDDDDGPGRSRWHTNLIRYLGADDGLAPLVLGGFGLAPSSSLLQFSIWAYARGAATLDLLRLVIGREAFGAGLRRWASDCARTRCTSDDFRRLMEQSAGRELGTFFAQYVIGTRLTEVAWRFTQSVSTEGATVTLHYTQSLAVTSELELQLELVDGPVDRRLVALSGREGTLTLHTARRVARARPNPYADPLIWIRSAVDGDVDFDGAVDGVDLVTCARFVSLGLPPISETANLFQVSPIDWRCDFDLSGTIDRTDLELLALGFGTIEAPCPTCEDTL